MRRSSRLKNKSFCQTPKAIEDINENERTVDVSVAEITTTTNELTDFNDKKDHEKGKVKQKEIAKCAEEIRVEDNVSEDNGSELKTKKIKTKKATKPSKKRIKVKNIESGSEGCDNQVVSKQNDAPNPPSEPTLTKGKEKMGKVFADHDVLEATVRKEIVSSGKKEKKDFDESKYVSVANRPFKCFNMSKYESLPTTKSRHCSGLMQTSLALKKNFPFKEYLMDRSQQKDDPLINGCSNTDTFGLDNVQITSDKNQIENDSTSSLKLDIDTSDLYFDKSEKKRGTQKDVEKIMKKSVLPADLERQEKVPKLFESEYKKKLLHKKASEETAGKGWFNMPKTEMTEETKRDIQLIKMRNVLDSKRHYKRNDTGKLPKYFQVGTVVEGAHEFYSTRLPKKQRKRTIVDELLDDADLRRKNKKKMIEIQKKQMGGGKGHYKKMQNKKKPTWART